MRKEQILDITKQEITEYLNKLGIYNISSIIKGIQAQLDILDRVEVAPFLDQEESTEAQEIVELEEEQEQEKETAEAPESTKEEVSDDSVALKEFVKEGGRIVEGYFHYNIRGGKVNTKQSIFVPEKICRELDLKNGDFLRAIQTNQTYDKTIYSYYNHRKPQYHFEIVQRAEKPEKETRRVHYSLPVKALEDVNRMYVEIKDDQTEMTATPILSDNDIDKYRLKPGDIIDYAHELNDTKFGRVIWKHHNQL